MNFIQTLSVPLNAAPCGHPAVVKCVEPKHAARLVLDAHEAVTLSSTAASL